MTTIVITLIQRYIVINDASKIADAIMKTKIITEIVLMLNTSRY